MNNAYRKLMEQQCLSEQAQQAFYYNLQRAEKGKSQRFLLKAVAVVACIILIIPITVYAVETIFGISIAEIVTGTTSSGKHGTGYEISYPEMTGRPLSDFPEEIQTFDGYMIAVYESWKEAEEELGITLVKNKILSDENTAKEYAYDLKNKGIFRRVHCFATYNGEDNQFYCATITAAYRYDEMEITVQSTVTCDHPAITKDDMNRMHWSSAMYENDDVDEILQEQYVAANGINATIVTIDRTGNKTTHYAAGFAANGASYRITMKAYGYGRDDEAKEMLIKILEGFIF